MFCDLDSSEIFYWMTKMEMGQTFNAQRSTFNIRPEAASALNVERWTLNVFFRPSLRDNLSCCGFAGKVLRGWRKDFVTGSLAKEIRSKPKRRKSFHRLVICLATFCLALANPGFARTRTKSTSRNQNPNATRADVVVIDPGHGGFDRGGIPGQRVPEKNMALDVALRLRQKLQAAGYRVIMTRDTDVFIPLPTRVAIANHYSNAIFICVHFNSATRIGANGIETYYYRRDSVTLASNIHKNVVGGAPSENRGIRQRGYYVLRRTSIPGVLVECGFLTNPTEARLAQTSAYRDKLAENISRGVLGKPPLVVREPASRNYPAATEVERQPFSTYMGTDFVRVPPEGTSRHHRKSSRSSRKKSSKHSSSSKKKKSTKKSED